MQAKLRFIALGVIGASAHFTLGTVQAQTALPGVTIESSGGAGAATEPGPSGGNQGPAAGGNPSTAIDGYVAESSSTGTKTNTPLREIPQSVSVVTRDQIEDRGAETLDEAIGYSAGIGVNPFGDDARFDQFIIRGFEQNVAGVYRDGLRLPVFSFTGFRIETYGADHIDILRGPTSVLYGLNNPGGLVNIVSKMPTEQAFGEVWASYGTHDNKAVGFDFGAPSDNGKVAYRITGLLRDADTQVDFVENDRVYIAPSLTLKPSDATTFTILANYQKDKTGDTFQLLPADAVLNGTIPRDTFLGEPDFSHLKGEQWGIGYQLEHRFDPAWTVRQTLRYDHATVDYQTIFPAGTAPPPLDPSHVVRQALAADQSVDLFQVDTNIEHKSRFERVENTFLVGVDYSHFTGDSTIGGSAVGNAANLFDPSFDPFNPTYGQFFFFNPITGLPVPFPETFQDQTLKQQTVGIYAQDQIKIDKRWIVTLGGRYDWVDSEVEDRFFGDADIAPDDSGSRKDEAFTYRAGLGYLFDNGLTPYVGYSTSFFPVALQGVSGATLEPEEGQQIEAGIKYQPKGFKSYGIVSVFDITKQNVTSANPGAPGTFIQTGEVQVRGLELEAVLDFDNGWKILGAYAHWNAEITEDEGGNVGNRPERIPADIASLWIDYTFRSGALEGLGIGAGVRYVGDTFGDAANVFEVPSYTLFDAALRYQWDSWNLALNVKNLLDEEYAGTCGAVGPENGLPAYEYCSFGSGRVATVKLGYRW